MSAARRAEIAVRREDTVLPTVASILRRSAASVLLPAVLQIGIHLLGIEIAGAARDVFAQQAFRIGKALAFDPDGRLHLGYVGPDDIGSQPIARHAGANRSKRGIVFRYLRHEQALLLGNVAADRIRREINAGDEFVRCIIEPFRNEVLQCLEACVFDRELAPLRQQGRALRDSVPGIQLDEDFAFFNPVAVRRPDRRDRACKLRLHHLDAPERNDPALPLRHHLDIEKRGKGDRTGKGTRDREKRQMEGR